MKSLPVPTPLLLLAASACAAQWVPGVDAPAQPVVEHLVSAALVVILFEGGSQIGVRRMGALTGRVLALGVGGTFATVAAVSVTAHALLGVGWFAAVLVGTALAPTDPAVVFSVLGRDGAAGRAGTLLQGESGANDPVGISLMVALVAAGSLSSEALAQAVSALGLQLGIGLALGAAGGLLIRRLPLPGLLWAAGLYGLAVVAHGSGFLAVFVAGILVADHEPGFARTHARLAGLAEVVAFCVLGLTVDLGVLTHHDVWLPGLVLGLRLALVLRPAVGFPLLLGSGLPASERAFVLLAGLKGAVPLLLGTMLVPLPDGPRLYGVTVAVVVLSVLLQGSAVPPLARRWRLAA
ncbi:MAG: cvrA [Frankiales bacterium]|nr:cvrA [Frankiales bacterium]